MTMIAFKAADQNKYSSVTRKFATDYTLDDDKYPRTLEKLSDTFNSHKWDATFFEKKKRAKEQLHLDKQGGTEERATSFAQHISRTSFPSQGCHKNRATLMKMRASNPRTPGPFGRKYFKRQNFVEEDCLDPCVAWGDPF